MFDKHKIKNRNLQCLRGLAILMVVITHALTVFWQHSYISSYFNFSIGVDLFFIISGYLMGVTFISKMSEPITLSDALQFYQKRIKRLFSTNLFWSFFVLIFSSVWVKASILPSKEIAYWLFLSNITFLSNIFNAYHSNMFGYFWSLSTEFQFYLVLPLFVFIFRSKFILGCIGILFILTFLNPFPVDIQWLFRWNSLFIGILVWKLTTLDLFQSIHNYIMLWNNKWKISISLFVLCLMAFFVHIAHLPWAINSTIIGLGFGSVMIVFLSSEKIIFGSLSYLIEWLGDISYSWYLCHIPSWLFVFEISTLMGTPEVSNFTAIISLITSVIFAALSYRYIESHGRSKSVIK